MCPLEDSAAPTFWREVHANYTAARQSQDICELLAHLDLSPAVIVGWSIAGQHVLLGADEVGTDLVRAVVVVDWDVGLKADRDFAADRIASVQGDREAFTSVRYGDSPRSRTGIRRGTDGSRAGRADECRRAEHGELVLLRTA